MVQGGGLLLDLFLIPSSHRIVELSPNQINTEQQSNDIQYSKTRAIV